MTFAEGLLTDFAAQAVLDDWRRRASPDGAMPMVSAADRQLLQSIATELHEFGAVLAIVTSIANVAEAQVFPHFDVTCIRAFTPNCSLLVSRALETAARCEEFTTLAQQGQTLRVRLSLARRVTRTYLDNVVHIDGQILCPIEIVADAWRRTCSAALALLGLIEAARAAGRGEGSGQETAATSSAMLLREAAGGGWPCVDAAGQLQVPGWAERRTGVRRKISLAAIATIGPHHYPASIRDISLTGVGVSIDGVVARPGSDITLLLADGRRLSGTVRWSAAGRIGIAFHEALSPAEDLLTGPAGSMKTA